MGSHATTAANNPQSAQRARLRALVIPREHGAWGLLLVPLFTGAAVGLMATPNVLPLSLFTLAALALFWLRTPVESLLGTTPMSAQTLAERRISFLVAAGLATISAACIAGLLWHGHNLGLFLLGGIAAVAFVVQTLIKRLGRQFRMTAQLIGSIGLTCTAPAAYYVITGHLNTRAWLLWLANWIFAGNQVHFVQLRIHAARAASFSEKFVKGKVFFLAQIGMFVTLATISLREIAAALILIAFLPALARGFYWFIRGPQPLQVRSLGWSEMRQGILFGILLSAAMLLS